MEVSWAKMYQKKPEEKKEKKKNRHEEKTSERRKCTRQYQAHISNRIHAIRRSIDTENNQESTHRWEKIKETIREVTQTNIGLENKQRNVKARDNQLEEKSIKQKEIRLQIDNARTKTKSAT